MAQRIRFPDIYIRRREMRMVIALMLLYSLVGVMATIAGAESGNDNLENSINYLIDFVESSDCIFIRNGREHTAKDAVAHLQKKYQYFKDEIQSPEDFIRLAASKSLISGKPYWIKTANGMKLKLKNWLLKALEIYRAKRRRTETNNPV